MELNNEFIPLNGTLIRAPKITNLGKDVIILAMLENSPVAVFQGIHLGLSFHPELDGTSIFHELLFNPSSKYYWNNLNKVDAA